MKKIILVAVLCPVLFISSCAALDSLILNRHKNNRGEELFIDKDGKLTTEPTGADGAPNEPAYGSEPGALSQLVSSAAGALLGPWGWAASGGVGLLTTAYAALRGRKRFNEKSAESAAWSSGMRLLVKVIEDIKSGKIDADKNGKISLKEIGEYVKRSGKEAANPEFVAEVVRVLTSTMTDTEKQAALDKAVKELA